MPALIAHPRFFIVLRKTLKGPPSTEPGLSSLAYIATLLWTRARLFERRRPSSSECWVPVDQSPEQSFRPDAR